MSYLKCPTCGQSPAQDTARYCYKDGTALISKKATCDCGNDVNLVYDKFCEICGKSTESAKVAES